ncbi:MAG: patatin-like phospholipase family protein [Pyrinomonadaceae bacterium]
MSRKKIGLALSGGGARGFAHVGVLKVLVENNIPIDMIAGTSAGSIIGGAFAAGMSIDEIFSMATKVGWTNMTRPSFSFGGLLSNAPMGNFLRRHFPVTRFEDLAIPFSAVSYDLATSKTVIFETTGDVIDAVRASCAVPGVFAPFRDEGGRSLVDGGVVSPIPVEVVRKMGADIVIAVDLLSCGSTFRSRSRTGLGIMLESVLALLQTVSYSEHQSADLIVEPQIAHLRPDQIGKRDEFLALGEKAAREKIDEIKNIVE